MEKETKDRTLKIAIVGVESSGKTTLCDQLGTHFGTNVIPEYSREYLKDIGVNYKEEDLLNIATGQLKLEQHLSEPEDKMIFCDTNLLVIIVWSIYKYGRCDAKILKLHANSRYDLTFVTHYDIPWEKDGLRENPDRYQRKELHDMYVQWLEKNDSKYAILKGNKVERLSQAMDHVNDLLGL